MAGRTYITAEEQELKVRKRMLSQATALHNACKESYKETRCVGCPFTITFGCTLNGHPIEWKDKLRKAKSE